MSSVFRFFVKRGGKPVLWKINMYLMLFSATFSQPDAKSFLSLATDGFVLEVCTIFDDMNAFPTFVWINVFGYALLLLPSD